MTKHKIIARGIFLSTSLASSAEVANASNQRKEKKTADAPVKIPLYPYGKNGCQLAGLIC